MNLKELREHLKSRIEELTDILLGVPEGHGYKKLILQSLEINEQMYLKCSKQITSYDYLQ